MLVIINNRISSTLIISPQFFLVFGAGPLPDPNVYQKLVVAAGVLLLFLYSYCNYY